MNNILTKKYTDYFIAADTHLNKSRDDLTANFFKLVNTIISNYDNACLIINGDFLDFWFENKKYDLNAEYPMFKQLREVTQKLDIYLIKGNRDFLADKRFEKCTNVKIIGDEYILETGNSRYLIAHGDIFCTKDITYKLWRIFSRSVFVKYLTLLIPEKKALAIIAKLRSISSVKTIRKKTLNLSIVLSAVEKKCEEHNCDTVICGHNHLLRNYSIVKYDGKKIKLIVLHKMHNWGTYYLHITSNKSQIVTLG